MKIQKLTVLFLLLLLCNYVARSQSKESIPLKERIKSSADSMASSLINKDYETFIKYMHPITVKGIGGKEKIMEIFKKGIPGVEIKEIQFSNLSDPVLSNNEIQCTIIETIRMKVKEGMLVNNSTLIGVSMDNGKNWYFIEPNNRSNAELKILYPNVSDRLKIEKQGPPTLFRE
jgi:hypothetical protein